MESIFSLNNGGIIERWFLRLEIDGGGLVLPNANDFGQESIIINHCLYNQSEYSNKLPKEMNIASIESMEKNSVMFDCEGGLPWQVVNQQSSPPLDFPITKQDYEESFALVVWADPFGSAAFLGDKYWKGVLIIKEISKFKTEEIVGKTKKNIINIKLQITQSIISYFIDLVDKYTTSNLPELKKIHDAYKKGDKNALGKLGVMGPSISQNDNFPDAIKNNSGEVIMGESGIDLYDGGYWFGEMWRAKKSFNIKWGDSNISIYDFKTPIKERYGEVMRIGNDARIYSNEGFSNLNWGIVGYQLELGPERMIKFAHMDPFSGNQDHDDAATRDGQRAGESAGIPQNNDIELMDEFPHAFDRRKLFLFIIKVLSENDLYTNLGVLKHQKQLQEKQAKEARENPIQFSLQDYPLF